MTSVAVVGGGIAGLTAAYRLHQLDPSVSVTVYEASDRAGGKVRTTSVAGIAVDEAIDGFLARVPAAVGLCRELGLGDDLESPAVRTAYVLRHGRLHRFPDGLVLGVPTDLDALRSSGVVSAAGVDRVALDLTTPADGPDGDESVGALVRRRVGDEVFEALVGPLLSGVNAGDADQLSLAAGAPQFAAAVADEAQPSLIEGLRRQRAAAAATDPEAPVFFALRGGMQTLTDALVAALPAGTVRTGAAASQLTRRADRWSVHLDGGDVVEADAVVLAVPSYAAAPLVAPFAGELTDGLASLEWASVALVTLVVRRADVDHALDASGFLVSESEGLTMTACSFGSSKWPRWRSPDDDLVVLRVSAGRHHQPEAWDLDDDELVRRLRDELGATIGLRGEPVAVRVSRWARALPQYRPGHLDRARRWKALAADQPGLFLTGASYFGLGLPACITDAEATAQLVADRLHGLDDRHDRHDLDTSGA